LWAVRALGPPRGAPRQPAARLGLARRPPEPLLGPAAVPPRPWQGAALPPHGPRSPAARDLVSWRRRCLAGPPAALGSSSVPWAPLPAAYPTTTIDRPLPGLRAPAGPAVPISCPRATGCAWQTR